MQLGTLVLASLLNVTWVAPPCPAQPAPLRGGIRNTRPRYDLDVKLDPGQHRLQGRATVWIPATAEPREALEFNLAANMRDLRIEVVAPTVSVGPARVEPQPPPNDGQSWIVQPMKPFPPNRAIQLRVEWQGGEKSSFVFYLGPEGSFASGINTPWYPLFGPDGLGTAMLRVTVPAGLTVHASGSQRSSGQEGARGVFRYEIATPSFFAFAAGRYTVFRRKGAVPISIYLLKDRGRVAEYIEGCQKSIQVLSDEFGPYRSGEFAIVEVPPTQAQQAGFVGASVTGFIMAAGTFLDEPFNLAYYGHEIAHQWWGNLIRHAGPNGRMMLDEAMAQYGSLRVVETLEGLTAAERYRRTGYPGYVANQSGLGYLRVVAAGQDFPLSNIPENASRALADGKGFQVWDLLSRTLGRDKFRQILRDFTARHAFQSVTWDQFLQSVTDGAGRDLKWFYDQWFERSGAPDWQLNWRQEGDIVRGEITQSGPYYRASLEVLAEGVEGRQQTSTIEVDGPRTEFTLFAKWAVQTVLLDPHFQVLRWTPEYHAAAPAFQLIDFQGAW